MAEATGLRNNALPYPVYGVPFGVVFPMLDADGDLVTAASTPDAEVSKNGDTFADCTNESTEIATGSGMYYLLLTGTELTADVVAVIAKSATAGMKTTPIVLYPRKLVTLRSGTVGANAADGTTLQLDSGASAVDDYYNGCLLVGTLDSVVEARVISDYVGSTKVCSVTPAFVTTPDNNDTFVVYLPEGRQVTQGDAVAFGGVGGTFSAGRPEVNTTHAAGTAWASGAITAAVIATGAIDADAIADNAIDAGAIADNAITAAKIANGAIDAATFAAGAIDAAAIATGAIDADAIAADAITAAKVAADVSAEIADAVWDEDATGHQTTGTFGQAIGDPVADTNTIYGAVVTGAAGATIAADIIDIEGKVDDVETRLGTPSDLGSGATVAANLVDIEGQTDDIGAAGAGLTALASAANLATVAGFVDTEVASIKAQTDKLTFDGDNHLAANVKKIDDDAAAAAAFETMLDGTGTATLSLKQLNIVNNSGSALVASSTGGNGHGIEASGHGTGEGLSATGGATGHGAAFVGGADGGNGLHASATDGNGAAFEGGGDNSAGVLAVGSGTGEGAYFLGGDEGGGMTIETGPSANDPALDCIGRGGGAGAQFLGGSSNGQGIRCEGQGGGSAMFLLGGTPNGSGLELSGGYSAVLAYSGTDAPGVEIYGNGTAPGVLVNGGATGNGLDIVGGATSGDGINISVTDGVKLNSADYTGAVVDDAGNSPSTFKTDLGETADDHWIGAYLKFTSGDLAGQVRKVTVYNGTSKFVTVDPAFTAEPADTDAFDLINE